MREREREREVVSSKQQFECTFTFDTDYPNIHARH